MYQAPTAVLRIDQKSLRQPRITVTPGCLEKIDSDRGGLRRYVRLRTLAGLYFIYKNSVEVLYVALSSWLAARDDCAQHQLPGNYGPAGALVRAGACGVRNAARPPWQWQLQCHCGSASGSAAAGSARGR